MRTWSAWSPRRPWAIPNSTRVPGLRVVVPSGNASLRTYTSGPSSCDRKPKPFSASNHFTLPVGTVTTSSSCNSGGVRKPRRRSLSGAIGFACRRNRFLDGGQVRLEPGGEHGQVGEHDVGARLDELLLRAPAGQHG